VVIKGAAYFDKLNDLGVLVSDKTGTLTYGDFRLQQGGAVSALDEGRFANDLTGGRMPERSSFSQSDLKGTNPGEISAKVTSYEIAGKGEKCVYEGSKLLAGRKSPF
jgi:cation transport ATPase